MKKTKQIFFVLLLLSLVAFEVKAQKNVFVQTRDALSIGSARELTNFLNDITEIQIDGRSSNYAKNQAEYVLKDFFKQNPPVGFSYIHEGSSKEGLHYAIGKYAHQKGSFRVYLLFKKINGAYVISTIDITKD